MPEEPGRRPPETMYDDGGVPSSDSPRPSATAQATPTVTLKSLMLPIFGPSLLFGVAEGAVLPVIALTAIHRGAGVATAALIAALIGVGSIATNIPASTITERFGERRAIFAAAGLCAIGFALCVIGFGLIPLAIGVLLVGGGSSVFSLARQMYLTEAAPAHLRARALSALGGSMRIGMFIGPFLGAGAIHLWGLDAAYFTAIVAVLLAGAAAVGIPDLEVPERVRQASSEIRARDVVRAHWRTLVTIGGGVVLLSAARQSRQVVIPLWAHHLHLEPAVVSLVYGVSGAIDALVFYPGGYAMDRFGRRYASTACVLLLSISFLLIPLTHTAGTLGLVALLMGFGNGLGSGIVMTLGADTSPQVGRALYLGIWRELGDLGAGGGPLLLSGLTAAVSLGFSIVVQGALGLIGAGMFVRWVVDRPRSGTTNNS